MLQKKHTLTIFTFPLFSGRGYPIQAMSTRLGGVSKGQYCSLNLGFHVDDEEEDVLINRRRFCQALSISPESVVTGQQVHRAEVAVVHGKDGGRGALRWEEGIPQTDALVTDSPDIALMVLVADCAAVILYDRTKRVIGIAHGSWRGTVAGIGRRTAQKMIDAFGCHPEDIQAGISPSIGPCCFRVGEEVTSAMKRSSATTWERFFVSRGNGAMHFNLREALRQQLVEIGLKDENIETANICTACRTDLFYSHRGEKGKTGRNGVIVALQED